MKTVAVDVVGKQRVLLQDPGFFVQPREPLRTRDNPALVSDVHPLPRQQEVFNLIAVRVVRLGERNLHELRTFNLSGFLDVLGDVRLIRRDDLPLDAVLSDTRA